MIWDLENKFVSILEYDKEWEEKTPKDRIRGWQK